MTEKEYIERGAALKKIDHAINEYVRHGEIVRFIGDCRSSIIYAPAVDVTEVRHGEWMAKDHVSISKRRRFIEYSTYKCSICGKWNGRHKQNFCPNCGAKMDGERKEQK